MITLKSIKINRQLSEETPCFSATVYFEGKKVGTVGNRGRGGPNQYGWNDRPSNPDVEAWALANVGDASYCDSPIDVFVNRALDNFEEQKQFKSWCRNKTVFNLVGDAAGTFRTINRKWCQAISNYLASEYGDRVDRVINQELYGCPKA